MFAGVAMDSSTQLKQRSGLQTPYNIISCVCGCSLLQLFPFMKHKRMYV